jgi:ATP-dependent protease ClpP protease subunit
MPYPYFAWHKNRGNTKVIIMTRILIALLCAIVLVGTAVAIESAPTAKEEKPPETFCPKTKISDNNQCFFCHTKPDFGLMEAKPDRQMDLPWGTRLVGGKLHMIIENVSASQVQEFFEYVYWHPQFKHVVIEIHSPGGSLLNAWKIVGLMDEAKSKGVTVETRCYGFAASAGFLIFVNGNIGLRFVNPTAELMHHELWSFKFFDLASPSKKEDEAEVFRHLQDTVHNWLVTRCTKEITKDELDNWVRHKDYWMNGAEKK